MILSNITEIAKVIWKEYIKSGDQVVDATLGNGKDTDFLRELVGDEGRVYAFDVQQAAIDATKNFIAKERQENIYFILDNHANIDRYIKSPVKAVIFNLGYLPSSDHAIRTCPKNSSEAVRKSLDLLDTGGILSVAAYLGHDQGEEYRVLRTLFRALDPKRYKVIEVNPINQSEFAPKLLLCQKAGIS